MHPHGKRMLPTGTWATSSAGCSHPRHEESRSCTKILLIPFSFGLPSGASMAGTLSLLSAFALMGLALLQLLMTRMS